MIIAFHAKECAGSPDIRWQVYRHGLKKFSITASRIENPQCDKRGNMRNYVRSEKSCEIRWSVVCPSFFHLFCGKSAFRCHENCHLGRPRYLAQYCEVFCR